MANIKQVQIQAKVRWGFCDRNEKLAAQFGRLMTNPHQGLCVKVAETGEYLPTSHGGKEPITLLTITGSEAVSWNWVKYLVHQLREYGEVTGKARDIEDLDYQINDWVKL